MKLTEIAHFSPDVDAMAAFYEKFLGTPPVARSDGMAIFMHEGVKIFLHHRYTPAEGELPPENHHAFTVPDVNAACAALAKAGIMVEIEPKDYYWGRSAYLRDPDGNQIELIQEA